MIAGMETTKHGCHNRKPYEAFYTCKGITKIPHVMTTDCQYSKTHEDVKCLGCKWKQNEKT